MTRTAAARASRPALDRRIPPMVLAGLLVLTAIAYPLASGAGRNFVTWSIVALGSAVSLVHAALSRGRRTAVGLLALVAVTATAFEAVGLATGVPYGHYRYSDELGPTLLGVPFLVPLAWLMMAWPSWLLGELLTRHVRVTRRRLVRPVVAAGIFAAWDVVLDPQLVQAGYWTWAHPRPGLPGIGTVPVTNLAGWLLAGLVLMAALDVLVVRTQAPDAPRLDATAPLLVLAWMTLGGALAQAGWLGLPGSAVWGAVLFLPLLGALIVQRRRAGPAR